MDCSNYLLLYQIGLGLSTSFSNFSDIFSEVISQPHKNIIPPSTPNVNPSTIAKTDSNPSQKTIGVMHGVALIERVFVEQVYPEQVFVERMYAERMFGGPTGHLPSLPGAPMYITCVGDVWFSWYLCL